MYTGAAVGAVVGTGSVWWRATWRATRRFAGRLSGCTGATVTPTTREGGDGGAAGGTTFGDASCPPPGPIRARAAPATPIEAATAARALILRIRWGIFAAVPDATRRRRPAPPGR